MSKQPIGSFTRATAAAFVLVAASGCGSVGTSIETDPAAPEATRVPVGDGGPGSIPSDSVKVSLEGETNGVAVCAGWVWVAVGAPRDAIAQVDPTSGEVVGEIMRGTNLACFDGEPWAAVGGTEIRHVSAETRETLASVPVRSFYVGTGAGSIWGASGRDVVRIDPDTGEVVATIPLDPSFDVTEVEGTDDAVWATVKEAATVYRIDPATNTVVARIGAGRFAHGILIQPDAVWISNAHEDTVTRIDPTTNAATFLVEGPGAGVGLGEGNGFVWASSRDGLLFRIDPTTNQAHRAVRIGGWPYGIASTDGVLWVSDGISSVYGIPFSELGG